MLKHIQCFLDVSLSYLCNNFFILNQQQIHYVRFLERLRQDKVQALKKKYNVRQVDFIVMRIHNAFDRIQNILCPLKLLL